MCAWRGVCLPTSSWEWSRLFRSLASAGPCGVPPNRLPFCDPPVAGQASSEIGDDVQLHSLMSKIALLCLHFPRLRIIWSRSLHATAGEAPRRLRTCLVFFLLLILTLAALVAPEQYVSQALLCLKHPNRTGREAVAAAKPESLLTVYSWVFEPCPGSHRGLEPHLQPSFSPHTCSHPLLRPRPLPFLPPAHLPLPRSFSPPPASAAAADIFQTLKANHEEPDPIAAAAVGVPEAEGGAGGAPGAESVVNQSAIDLLRRLPGVVPCFVPQ